MITVGKSAEIAAAIAVQQAAVSAYEAALTAAGMKFQGNTFQINAGSISDMEGVMLGFLIGQTNPSGGQWRDINNVMITMDDPTVKALILAAKVYVQALMFNAWTHIDAIAKLTTLAAVAAYDFSTGWPPNTN